MAVGQWSMLPPELQRRILQRLPLLESVRFRLVCKAWCSILSNVAGPPGPWFLVCWKDSNNLGWALHDYRTGEWIRLPDLNLWVGHYKVVSSGGLACVKVGFCTFCAGNPLFQSSWHRPTDTIPYDSYGGGLFNLLGLFVNRDRQSFKVLVGHGGLGQTFLYESGTRSWTRIDQLAEIDASRIQQVPLEWNSSLYWFVFPGNLVSFDFATQSWSKVAFSVTQSLDHATLMQHGGRIYLAGAVLDDGFFGDYKSFRVWLLDETNLEMTLVSQMPDELFQHFHVRDCYACGASDAVLLLVSRTMTLCYDVPNNIWHKKPPDLTRLCCHKRIQHVLPFEPTIMDGITTRRYNDMQVRTGRTQQPS